MSLPRRQFLGYSLCSLPCLFTGAVALGEVQRKRARLRSALPNHQYDHSLEQLQQTVVSDAGVIDQVVLSLEHIRLLHTAAPELLPGEGNAPIPGDSIRRRPGFTDTRIVDGQRRATLPSIHNTTDPSAAPQLVLRKQFVALVPALTVGFVTLDQIALAVYETGYIECSGQLTHSGGNNQELQGSKIAIRVRAYGQNPQANFPPPNGPLLASWEQQRWLSFRSSPEVIRLVDKDCDAAVRSKFDQISHMAVNLITYRSR